MSRARAREVEPVLSPEQLFPLCPCRNAEGTEADGLGMKWWKFVLFVIAAKNLLFLLPGPRLIAGARQTLNSGSFLVTPVLRSRANTGNPSR
jgi:hypothetical protein